MMLVSIIGLFSSTPPENNIRNDRDRLIQDCGYKANKAPWKSRDGAIEKPQSLQNKLYININYNFFN